MYESSQGVGENYSQKPKYYKYCRYGLKHSVAGSGVRAIIGSVPAQLPARGLLSV